MHVAAMTSVSLFWSTGVHSVSYFVCSLQPLKCALFSAKCSHYACHHEYNDIFTYICNYG